MHCMLLFTCDCAVDSIVVLVSRCNANVKLQKEKPLDSILLFQTKVSLINILEASKFNASMAFMPYLLNVC